MKNKICLSVFLLTCFGFVGCLKVESKSNSAESPKEEAPAVATVDSKITYVVKGKDEPNQYSVHFSEVENLYVRKMKNGVSTVDRSNHYEYVDNDVVSGEQITYQFYRESGTQQTILESVDVKIPRDLVFDKKIILNKKTIEELGLTVDEAGVFRKVSTNHFRRIFFLKGAVFVSSGENLEFIADEIHFHQTVIQTFEVGQTGLQGKEGRHGGTLNFKARLMSGDVFVELRGENGGQGLNGLPPDAKLAGANGFPGKSPQIFSAGNCSIFEIICEGCGSPGLPGGDGHNGRDGYPGDPGFKGGNSGELNWTAQDATNLNWRVVKTPGEGGGGGLGGAGGAPGKGDQGSTSVCGVVPAKSDGIQGGPGIDGPPGVSGQAETACLKILEEKICK